MTKSAAKIENRDAATLRALVDATTRWTGASVLDTIVPALAPLLRAEMGGAYRIGAGADRCEVDLVQMDGVPARFHPVFARYAASTSITDFTLFDALTPAKEERNRALSPTERWTYDQIAQHRMSEHFLRPLRLDRHHQLRVLLCEGSNLLAWFGVLGNEPFGAREKRLLGALAKPVARRLALERRMRDSAVYQRGFEAAVEALSVPAFLVRGDCIAHANALGRSLLARPGFDLFVQMRAVCAGLEDSLEIRPLAAPGDEGYALVVGTMRQRDIEARLVAAARTWRLTPKQVEALRHLACGDANKTIAERMRCTVATIEVHVTNVLRASRCDSRAALVAKFWSGIG